MSKKEQENHYPHFMPNLDFFNDEKCDKYDQKEHNLQKYT